MKLTSRLIPALVAAAFLASGSLRADEAAQEKVGGENEPDASAAPLPVVALTPKLLYQFLLAEIAGQRGQLSSAAEVYRELAIETRDPRIARRATELSLHGRRMDFALQSAQLWFEIDPSSAQARQTVISLLAAQGRHEELKKIVAAMLAAEPQQIGQNLMYLNRLFSRSSDRAAVRGLIEALTTPYLNLPEAHYARALAAFEARDLSAARSAIQHALEMRPAWEAAALLRFQLIENRTEAADSLGSFVAANPQSREARLAHARALVGEKRYAEARREFNHLIEQATTGKDSAVSSADLIFAAAVLSIQLDEPAQAEKQLRRLIDVGYAEADKVRFYLGQITEDGKRWDEALQWFGGIAPGEYYLRARQHAAALLAKQGKLDEARRQLAGAEAANPSERAQLLIGEAQLLREAGKLADAHAVLEAGLTKQPDQPDLLYEIALVAERMGRPDELERRLRRLIELKPDHAHAFNALGYSLADRNERLPEARKLIERALELSPNDPFILDSKGWVQFRQGEPKAALETLNAAFNLRADPEIAAHLGEVLWVLGRQSEAKATLDKALRENPANEALTETIKRLKP